MMYNPRHPGEIVQNLCLKPLDLSVTKGAELLKVSRKTLSELVNGRRGISADMAERLAIVFGSDARFWMTLQLNYELWIQQNKKKKLELHHYRKAS